MPGFEIQSQQDQFLPRGAQSAGTPGRGLVRTLDDSKPIGNGDLPTTPVKPTGPSAADLAGRPVGPYQGENVGAQPWAGQDMTGVRPGYDNRDWTYVQNPDAYQYGGVRGGAAREEQNYQYNAGQSGAKMNAAQAAFAKQMQQAQGSRAQQMQGLGYLQNQINGTGPSVAQAQMNQGIANARTQQASIAASARGGGANLAAAQQASANAAAGLSGQAIQQGGVLRAGETMNAMNAYGQQAAGIRSADMQGAQLQGSQQQLYNSQQQYYDQARQGIMQQQMGAQQAGEQQNAAYGSAIQGLNYQANRDANQRSDNTTGAILGALGSIGTGIAFGVLSDERAKQGITEAGADLDDAMAKLKPYRYEYKDKYKSDPNGDDGSQVGIMAQHLASSRAGLSAIQKRPDGMLAVKLPQATGLALAGLARLNERLSKLEGARHAGE